jgi:hypothetical protein
MRHDEVTVSGIGRCGMSGMHSAHLGLVTDHEAAPAHWPESVAASYDHNLIQ